jgi:hypothetical protein
MKPGVFLLISNKNKDSFIGQDNQLSAFLDKWNICHHLLSLIIN